MSHDVVAQTVVGFTGQSPVAGLDVHHSGGVQKVPEFLNGEVANSSEMDAGGVQKAGPFLNEKAGLRNGEGKLREPGARELDAPRELANVLAPAEESPKLPALVPIGTMGRPRVLTPELKEKLFLLLSVGFSRRQAASYLGISHGTISNLANQNPEFAAELRRAEELTALQSEMTIMAEARKNWKAAAWYLTFKLKNPPPLTEEEKEERHQAKLADERRKAAEMTAFLNATKEPATPFPFDRSAFESAASPGLPKVQRKPRRGK